ncbi:15533_t:CDS:2, partial [Acaulospora morrowiae]
SFETLIQQHAEKGKDFILARVTTADSLDESKTYQSYYSAHHINKVLFRTQPEQGLLHRMKAKNPLNNMNIIGDVHYYVVKAESVILTQQSFAKSSALSISSHKTLHLNGDGITMAEISATSALEKSDRDFLIKVGEDSNESLNRVGGSRPSSPSTRQFDQQSPNGIALRKMENALERERRWSSGDLLQQPQMVFIPEYSQKVRRHQSMIFPNSSSSILNSRKTDTRISPSNIINAESIQSREDKDSIIMRNEPDTTNTTTLEKPCKPNQELKPICKAIFYATDDDFLMKSQVRQYFKTNAMDPLDSQLFSINTATQISNATGALGLISQNFDDSLANEQRIKMAGINVYDIWNFIDKVCGQCNLCLSHGILVDVMSVSGVLRWERGVLFGKVMDLDREI